MNCPECDSDDVTKEVDDDRSEFHSNDEYFEVNDCICNNCGCCFTETVEVHIIVTKHGYEVDEEEDGEK